VQKDCPRKAVTLEGIARRFLLCALLLVVGCTERSWASQWKGDKSVARTEILALVPPGTPIAAATRLLEAKGCTCREIRNYRPWPGFAGPFDYLSCSIDDTTGSFRIVFRSWHITLTESDAGAVDDVLLVTGLTGP
jgi:hypothetical protein